MDPAVIACVELPVTALLYGMLGLYRVRQQRWFRRAVDRCAALVVEPYHAAAKRWWAEDDVSAAAARLLLDGLVTVNHRGSLSLTPAGADPARRAGHPLPDALLCALRRRTAPAPLGSVESRDSEFRTVREQFHATSLARLRARLPEPFRGPGVPAKAGTLLLLGWLLFTTGVLMGIPARGTTDRFAAWVIWWSLIAQIVWFGLYGRQLRRTGSLPEILERHVAALSRHPALTELAERDPEALAWLGRSRLRTRRRRNRGRPRRRTTPAGTAG
ncbi:hypothetical protein [Streptomyces sp. NPDC089799]|uniref:hypothetical protein n=1 Tax=Streptomyces sp. NPDC089799 TaxID=3155066 RepID=UPI003437FCBE